MQPFHSGRDCFHGWYDGIATSGPDAAACGGAGAPAGSAAVRWSEPSAASPIGGRKVRVHGAAPLATAKEAERVFATANKNVRVRSCFGQNKNVIASLAKDVKTRPYPGKVRTYV